MVNKDKVKVELEIVFLVLILITGGYFLVFHHGITGALTGLSEAQVDAEILDRLETNDEVSVVVMLRNDPKSELSLDEKKDKISSNQKKVLDDLDLEDSTIFGIKQKQEFNLERKYETVNAISGKITKDGLKKLQKDYHVAQVKFDLPIHLLLSESGPMIQSDKVNLLNFTGSGQTVCVVDTGADYTHPALGNCTSEEFIDGSCSKVIAGVDIADNDNDPLDLNGHGSHVSGIVASIDDTYTGIAPGARIAAVKVFPGSSGGTNLSNVIGGLDWCITNSNIYNISVITLSLGDGAKYTEPCDTHPLSVVVNNAVNAGIFVDVASGNNGHNNGINAPACASGVTAVGATDKQGNLASYSNLVDFLEVVAPGSSISSLSLSSGFTSKTGTSMAAPHVAGAAAIVKQYFMEVYNQSLSPAEISGKLVSKGEAIKKGNDYYYLVNLLSTLTPVLTITSPLNGTVLNTSEVLIEMNSDLGLTMAWLEVNGVNYSMQMINDTYFILNLTNITSSITYKVYGVNSGNVRGETNQETLIIETIPPEVVLPFNVTYANAGEVYINISVTDRHSEINLVKFNLTRDNVTLNYNVSNLNGSWILMINVSSLEEGIWLVNLFADDSRGNVNDTESFTLVVDRILPMFNGYSITNLTNLTNDTFYKNSTVTFNVNASDTYLGQVLLSTDLSGQFVNHTMTLENDSLYSFSLTNLSRGNSSFSFYVLDLAGNIINSSVYDIFVNNNPPYNLTLTPLSGSYDQETVVSFTAFASDLDNDILTYNWNFGDSATSSGPSVEHTYLSSGNFSVSVSASDSLHEVTGSITIEIFAPVINSTPDDNSGDNSGNDGGSTDPPASSGSSSGGGGGGGSSGGGSSETTSVSSTPDNTDFEFPEIEDFVVDETSEIQVANAVEVQPAEPEIISPEEKSSKFSLVGGVVTDFISNRKGLSYAGIVILSLICIGLTVFTVLRKRHQSEIYGIEAVKTSRDQKKSEKNSIKNMKLEKIQKDEKVSIFKRIHIKWEK